MISTKLFIGILVHLSFKDVSNLPCCLQLILSGLAEILSLGALIPFLSVISDPQSLEKISFLQTLLKNAGIETVNGLIIIVSAFFVCAVLIAALIRVFNIWLNFRFASAVGSDLSCDAYFKTLYQPYHVHIRLNSSVVIANLTTHIEQTVLGLNAFLQSQLP